MEASAVRKKTKKKSKSKITESIEKFGTNARTALNAVLTPTQPQGIENSEKAEASNTTTQKGLASLFRRKSSDNDKNEIIEMNQAKDSASADKITTASLKEDKEEQNMKLLSEGSTLPSGSGLASGVDVSADNKDKDEKNMKLLSEGSTLASGSGLPTGVDASADNKGLLMKTPLFVHRIIPDIEELKRTFPVEDEPDSEEEQLQNSPLPLTQTKFCTFSKKARWKRSSMKSTSNEPFPRRHTFIYEAEDELETSEEEETEVEQESDNELEDIEEEPYDEICENTSLLHTHLVVKLPAEGNNGVKDEDTKKTMQQAISSINKTSASIIYDQAAPSTSRGHPNGTCSMIPQDPVKHSAMCKSSSTFSCNKKTEPVEVKVLQKRSLFSNYFECRSISTLSNVSTVDLSFLKEENKSDEDLDETKCGKLLNGVRYCFTSTYQTFLSLICGSWRIITCTKKSCLNSSISTSEENTQQI